MTPVRSSREEITFGQRCRTQGDGSTRRGSLKVPTHEVSFVGRDLAGTAPYGRARRTIPPEIPNTSALRATLPTPSSLRAPNSFLFVTQFLPFCFRDTRKRCYVWSPRVVVDVGVALDDDMPTNTKFALLFFTVVAVPVPLTPSYVQ